MFAEVVRVARQRLTRAVREAYYRTRLAESAYTSPMMVYVQGGFKAGPRVILC